jgi:hypothetical protein
MQFITTKKSVTVSALTQEVFDTNKVKSAAVKHAQAALREANPHWGEHTKLPAGTLVLVPEVPGLRASASQPTPVVSAAVVDQLKQVLANAQAVSQNSAVTAAREIEASVALAKSKDLIVLIREAPELRIRLAQINEQAKVQLKQIETDKAAQLQGLAQLAKDLGTLS